MKDEEFLLYAYKGDQNAVRLALTLRHMSHAIDDMIDRDKPVSDAKIIDTFWAALILLPSNPFYAEHAPELHPLLAAALMNWQIANVLERGSLEDRHIAHSLRYDLSTVLVMIACIIGGRAWAEQVGPEIRRRCQRQPLAEYVKELEQRYPMREATDASA